MQEDNSQTKPLRSRLRSALIWGWVLFGVTLVAVPAFGLLAAMSSFTTCSPPACGPNHRGDAAALTMLIIYFLDLSVTVVFLIFGARSIRRLRRNGADASITKAARRVRTSSIIQLSILIAPVIWFYLYVFAVTYWR